MEKNKNLWLGLGAIIVIALIFWVVNRNTEETPPEKENLGIEAESTEDTSEGSIKAKSPSAPALTYAQALAQYQNARIQIKPDCQVTPNNVTYKNGASIMLDNRSALSHSIKLGSSTYSVKAWGFKIVKLTSVSALPATWYMDCDSSQNVATVLIQK